MPGVTPIPDVPDAPTIGAATDVGTSRAFNNGAATVAYTAAATGGAVTTFTATSTPGSFTATGASPITVTGLTPGTAYTFTVKGTNTTATGPDSAASASITATTVPQAPTIGTATVPLVSQAVDVAFTANATGGKAITSYTATSSPGSITGSGSSSPIRVTGLTNGTAYTFTVTATNANGTSAASSASNSVTPAQPSNLIRLFSSNLNQTLSSEAVATDSSGNIYVAGYSGAEGDKSYIVKFDSSGTLLFKHKLTDMYSVNDLKIDSSGNILFCGYSAAFEGVVIKLQSNLNISWQRKIGTAVVRTLNLDSSNNLYIAGTWSGNGGYGLKLDTSGTSQLGVQLNAGTTSAIEGMTTDSSGNIFVTGHYWANTDRHDLYLSKLNSSGTVQWSRILRLPNQAKEDYGRNLKCDSSGNVYIIGTIGGVSNNYDTGLIKYDTSGNLQWQRRITSGRDMQESYEIEIDSSSNVYIAFKNDPTSGANDAFLLKYNSSGTLQWQRAFSNNTEDYSARIALDQNNNPVIAFAVDNSGTRQVFVLGYPADGSKTGNYTVGSQTVNISASSLTDSDWGATSASSINPTSNNPGNTGRTGLDVALATTLSSQAVQY